MRTFSVFMHAHRLPKYIENKPFLQLITISLSRSCRSSIRLLYPGPRRTMFHSSELDILERKGRSFHLFTYIMYVCLLASLLLGSRLQHYLHTGPPTRTLVAGSRRLKKVSETMAFPWRISITLFPGQPRKQIRALNLAQQL